MIKIPNITGLVKVGKTFIQANRPEILFGASVTATLASVALAAKGGYEARGVIDAEILRRIKESPTEELHNNPDVAKLTNKEKIQLTWLCYMPAAVGTIGALGSTTGLHIVHLKDKKQMAAMALSAIEEVRQSAREYIEDIQDSVEENLTEKQQNKVIEAVNEKQADRHGGTIPVISSDGDIEELYLVRDARTGRDIWSNQHRIEDALIEVNNVINGSGDCELAHFYNHAGFNSIPDGTKYGWSGALVSLEWKETKRDDGRPVREFTFRPEPEKGYDDAHR